MLFPSIRGIRLGCLNCAFLTYTQVLRLKGLSHRGWIANYLSVKTKCATENVNTLIVRISASFLGEVAYGDKPLQLENSARFLLADAAIKAPC